MTKTILQVAQDLDRDGFQDEEGVEHYDDQVRTPYGNLGNLVTSRDADGLKIKKTPPVILVSKSLKDGGGITLKNTPLGFRLMHIDATNGTAEYLLCDDTELEWSDRPGEPVPHYLATLTTEDWVDAGD